MSERRAIYYDTETTGISPETNYIIELAAYDPVENRTFERLIKPACPIPPGATAVHHITDEMVADAPPFSEIAEEFIAFCEGNTVLIAHNNDRFDVHFLRKEYQRSDIEMPDWNFLDTLVWARRYRPDLPRHSLQFLREMYGIEENNAHRALEDVKILHQLFQMMIDDLSIDEVYSLLKEPRLIQNMPFGKHQGTPLAEVPSNYINWLKKEGFFQKPDNESLRQSLEAIGKL